MQESAFKLAIEAANRKSGAILKIIPDFSGIFNDFLTFYLKCIWRCSKSTIRTLDQTNNKFWIKIFLAMSVNRVRINESRFRKWDLFFIFHDAVFTTCFLAVLATKSYYQNIM